MSDLDAIFSPGSVAVIGASTTPGKVGHDIFANILRGGFKGTLYPVNPSARSILCVKSYSSILEIPDPVDLAMVIVPPGIAEKTVGDAIEKGVKGVVIVSAGFREVGGEGLEIENRIVAMCRKAGVRLIGPNCLGVINPMEDVRLNASFSARMPASGNISFISQSGALCTAVLDFAADRDFGFSKFVSIGNKADVDELDLLRYLHADPGTSVIMIYLEELRRGPEFVEAVREITSGGRPMPVLVIKSGRTGAGARAAASHTGALAGSEAVYEAIFDQTGIIRADSIGELFDLAEAFNYKHETALGKMIRKLPAGNRVAIVTNAGGPGILATDVTVSAGLALAEFQPGTIEALSRHLPSAANLKNPVDVIGDADPNRYERALEAVINDENVDGALVILTPQSMTNALETARVIVKIARRSYKPILCSFMGIIDVSAGVKFLQEHGYPVYKFPESAARAFAALYRYSRWISRPHVPDFQLEHDTDRASRVIESCIQQGRTYLGELESVEILKSYGFNTLPGSLARSSNEAVQIAAEIGYPVALKIVSPQIIHKTDAGGVRIDLKDEIQVAAAFESIISNAKAFNSEAEISGVLVQKMAPSGYEVILGMHRYPIFGPLLMFGLGGVFVEVFKDVIFRLAPVNRSSAMRMVTGIQASRLFSGYRGKPEADIYEIERLIVCLSDMAMRHPEILELDVNPLLVHEKGRGATVADCRIILKSPEMPKQP